MCKRDDFSEYFENYVEKVLGFRYTRNNKRTKESSLSENSVQYIE